MKYIVALLATRMRGNQELQPREENINEDLFDHESYACLIAKTSLFLGTLAALSVKNLTNGNIRFLGEGP